MNPQVLAFSVETGGRPALTVAVRPQGRRFRGFPEESTQSTAAVSPVGGLGGGSLAPLLTS
jgi:hypothetical protein